MASCRRLTVSPCRCGLFVLQVLMEANAVAEGIDDVNTHEVVESRLDSRAEVLVVLAGDLSMEFLDTGHPDEDGRARAAVAMMLGQVQHQSRPGQLDVGGCVFCKMMLPVEREAEVTDVELLRL